MTGQQPTHRPPPTDAALLQAPLLRQTGGQQHLRLLLRPRALHGHAGPDHSRVAPVPPHAVGAEGGARPTEPAQRPPEDGPRTGRSGPRRRPGHTQPLDLIQQVEVVDRNADVRLALAVPGALPPPGPRFRHLLQDGPRRLGGEEVVVGGALEVEAQRGVRTASPAGLRRRASLSAAPGQGGGVRRGGGVGALGGDGGAEQQPPAALPGLRPLALVVVHGRRDAPLLQKAH